LFDFEKSWNNRKPNVVIDPMKNLIALVAIGLILVMTVEPATAQLKSFTETVPLSSGRGLILQATKGSVRLTGWDREQVEIRARIETDSKSTEYARRALDATTVEVTTTASHVMIRSNYDNLRTTGWLFKVWQETPSIHYEIRAPKRIDLRLDIDRSVTTLSGFEGRIVLELDRSEVEVADLAGDLRVNIDRGGDSSFRNIRGSININADRTDLRIDLLSLNGPSRIEIDRGDADVSVARDQGFDLATSLSRRTDFDTNVSPLFRSRDRRNPSGLINGGGPRLSINADRGSVRLRS